MTFLFGLGMLIVGCGGSLPSGLDDAFEATPMVETEELVRLGGADAQGAAAIGSIAAAVLLDEEEMLIVQDGHSQEVHRFGFDGSYAGTFGGRGAGPGESLAGRGLGVGGAGVICMWDVRLSRVTRFDSVGRVLSTATLEFEHPGLLLDLTGFTRDCGTVFMSRRVDRATRRREVGILHDSAAFSYFGPDGVHVRDLAVAPMVDLEWRRFPDGNGAAVRRILGAEVRAVLETDVLWVGTNDVLAWDRFSLRGDVIGSLELPAPERIPTTEEIRLERERRVEEDPIPGLGGPTAESYRQAYRSKLRELPAATRVPMYDRITVASDGSGIWIRTSWLAGDPEVRWLLLRPRKGVVGQLILPEALELLSATADRLLLASVDAFDVPVLEVFRWEIPNADTAPRGASAGSRPQPDSFSGRN